VQNEPGVYQAWNIGLKNANGEFISYIDDDVIVSPKWLKSLSESFSLSEKIAGVSGPTIIPKERIKNRDFILFVSGQKLNPIMRLVGKIYVSVVLEGRALDVGRIFRSGMFSPGSNFPRSLSLGTIDVDYVEACNMTYRKSLIEKLGGFNGTVYNQEWSEDELCFRIRRLGYKLIFNSEAAVQHLVSPAGGADRMDAYGRSLDFIHFYFRNVRPDSIDKSLRFSLAVLFWVGYWFYKSFKSKKLIWLTGIVGLIKGIIEHSKCTQNKSLSNETSKRQHT